MYQNSLEKYLKCVLLLAAVEATDIGHNLIASLNKLNGSGILQSDLSAPAIKFIGRLEEVGWASYFEVSWSIHDVDLTHLDAAVWEVRRYCQMLNRYPGCVHPEVRKLDELLGTEVGTDKNIFLPSGFLEAALPNQEHPARRPLVWKNFYYSALKSKRIVIPVKLQAENAPLYLFPEIMDEVAKYLKMSKPARTAFQLLASK